MTKDPICGKEVDPLRARAVGIFGGVTYYFCSQDCKARFVDPRRAPREPTREISARPAKSVAAESAPAISPSSPPAAAQKSAPIAVAASKPAPAADPEAADRDEESDEENDDDAAEAAPIKKDPSPSVMEELRAVQPGWNRIWIVIAVLLVAAGGVLFYLYRRG